MREVVVPSSVKTIGEFAFNECYGLEKLVISKGVKEICKGAFAYCYGLREVVIPSSVNTIGSCAFALCPSLEIVHLPASLSSIEADSFEGCDNLKAIYVPENKLDFYKSCFQAEMHWLIVEEGSDLPSKADNFIAKDATFTQTLRVIVPNGQPDSYVLSEVKKELENWTNDEIINWVIDHLATITDSKEPYDVEKDR